MHGVFRPDLSMFSSSVKGRRFHADFSSSQIRLPCVHEDFWPDLSMFSSSVMGRRFHVDFSSSQNRLPSMHGVFRPDLSMFFIVSEGQALSRGLFFIADPPALHARGVSAGPEHVFHRQ